MGADFVLQLLLNYKYAVVAPAALVFGPLVSLVAGVLLRLDYLELIPTCLALAAGELGSDVLWYVLGKKYGESFVQRFGRFVNISPHSLARAKELFNQRHEVIIFTSKITGGLGLGIPIMFTAGLSRVPFRRYMMLNIVGQFLWTASLLSLGYFLGHLYLEIGSVFEKVALFALMAIILVSLVGFGKYLRSS